MRRRHLLRAPEDGAGATDGREPDVDVTDTATEWDPADESTKPARKSTPLERFNAYIGSFIAINRDENGDLPQVGQFPAPTADNFTRVFENDAQRFSGATNVPLAQLGVLSNTYTSSDALGAANDPLILEVERINADNKETLEEVARMMMAVAGGVPLDGLTEQQRGVQAYFQDPSMPTIAARGRVDEARGRGQRHRGHGRLLRGRGALAPDHPAPSRRDQAAGGHREPRPHGRRHGGGGRR